MGIRYVFLCTLVFFSSFISSGHAVTGTVVCDHEDKCPVNDGNLTGLLSSTDLNDSKGSHIEYLNLSRNNITSINNSLWEWLGDSLKILDLSFNEIGTFPTSGINNLKSLESLNLSSNQVSQLNMSTIAQLPNLLYLDVSLNAMTLEVEPGGFSKLIHLNLAGNNLTPESFPNLGKILNLTYLNISDDKLSESIPTSDDIGKLIHLTHLDLSKNNLSAMDFGSIESLSSLVFLDVSNASLYGSVKLKEILELGSLTELFLSQNSFDSLDSSSGIANTSKLEHIDLSGNNLSGSTILAEILELGNLTKLDLSSNNLGPQDYNLSRQKPVSSKLEYLDLSGNNLTGSTFLTEILQNLPKLKHLDLSKANLDGSTIPTEILNLTKLTLLNLSYNSFSGNIPNFTRLPNLAVLDLSHNNLTGKISNSFKEKMRKMGKDNVDISNNKICLGDDPFLKSVGPNNSCPDGPRSAKKKKKDHSGWKIALAVILPIFVITAAITYLVVDCRRRRKLWEPRQLRNQSSGEYARKNLSGPFKFQTATTKWSVDIKLAKSVPVVIIDNPLARYTFADLLDATSGFDRKSLLAEERFGLVYAGKLPEGPRISINVLVHGTRLADREVANELERIGRMNHPNLVPLIGYCIAGSQKMVIYDYMENGNLHDLLHEPPPPPPDSNSDEELSESQNTYAWIDENNQIHNMTYEHQGQNTWIFRHRIAVGVARGLAYLHHGHSLQMVHGNVKSSNIFLDSTFSPRFSDYGLDILVVTADDENTDKPPPMETAAKPERDVYDFGVLLFELVTGRNQVGWVRELVKKNRLSLSEVIDRKIRNSGDEKQMLEGLRIGYLCTAEVVSKRPSMQQVIGLLKDIEPNVVVDLPN